MLWLAVPADTFDYFKQGLRDALLNEKSFHWLLASASSKRKMKQHRLCNTTGMD
jgi:hypothetical protein